MWAVPKNDLTGENAVECGVIAIASVDCSDVAGCEEHALLCPGCGKPVCEYCADEHGLPRPARLERAA